ncbi:hypothetical protein B0I35DRAFT_194982 [Stachybotrys elegans]|uniref:Uncharacterized protein n=1 Tax=Stachybotrys elegans TaxID=80388 RepID=A0A8K0SD55_9HYPO|nr:hypothetical protein B0I35DRAFT_194982 [Stachybotrys elegans]
MDPFTATTAVIAAICAIVGAINTAQQMYNEHKGKKAEKAERVSLMDGSPEANTSSSAFEFTQRMNNLVSRFGRGFGSKLDEKVKDQLLRLQPQLKALRSDLNILKVDFASGRSTIDREKRRTELLGRANQLKDEIEGALTQFADRADVPIESPETTRGTMARPLKCCYGAILCQLGEADSRELSVKGIDNAKQWGFVCKYCFLEVGDYNAVRFSRRGEPVIYSDMLAASHVIACPSFADRRAYYKCLACYANHKDLDFPSASAFEKHMQSHPGYSFIRNEKKASDETKEKIEQYFILESKVEGLPGTETNTTADDNLERYASEEGVKASDVSPISSPELKSQEVMEKRARAAPQEPKLQGHPIKPPAAPLAPGFELPSEPYHDRNIPLEMPGEQAVNSLADAAEMSADNLHGMPSFYGPSGPYSQQQQSLPYRGDPYGVDSRAAPRYQQNMVQDPYTLHGISSSAPPTIRPSDAERAPSCGLIAPPALQPQVQRMHTQPPTNSGERMNQGQRGHSTAQGQSNYPSLSTKESSGSRLKNLFNNH